MIEPLLARSLLFVPAVRPDRFAKAAASGVAIVAVNLEDSVAAGDKAAGREHAFAWLAAPRSGRAARALALLDAPVQPDLLVLPKVEAAADLEQVDMLLGPLSSPTRLLALIESAKVLAHLPAIARSTPRLRGLMVSSAGLSADLRAANSWESLLYARSLLVAAAAAAGLEDGGRGRISRDGGFPPWASASEIWPTKG